MRGVLDMLNKQGRTEDGTPEQAIWRRGGQIKLEESAGWPEKERMISLRALMNSMQASQNPTAVECNPGRP